MAHPGRFLLAAAILVVVPFGYLLALRPFDARLGLTGTYFAGPDWQGTGYSVVDREISTDLLRRRVRRFGTGPFSVSWSGFLAIEHPGTYQFDVVSDDGSLLEIDNRLVVDDGGTHGPQSARGAAELKAGLHPIHLKFFQSGGDWRLDLFWARDHQVPVRIPRSALLLAPLREWQYTVFKALYDCAPFVPVLWIAAACTLLIRYMSRARELIREILSFPLFGVVLASLILNGAAIWWGLPSDWAPDELGPNDILWWLQHGFTKGWYSPYPPFHYYLLSLFYGPFLLAGSLRPVGGGPAYMTLFLVNRVVSAVMAAGTVVTCYYCGRALRGPLAGLIAAVSTALLLPFVFYAKFGNVDVPYMFWFALAIFFYIRILQGGVAASYSGFAVAATLALCTKDQAYGFFVLPALHVLAIRYRQLAGTDARPLRALSRDGPLLSAVLLAVASFAVCHNLLFNWSGFVSHVRLIAGPLGGHYQMFPATVAGRARLFFYSVQLVRWSFGWPAFLVTALALVVSVVRRDRSLWLLLPAASYYLFFVYVVMYAYDRYLLGVCMLLAIIAACQVADWVKGGARRAGIAIAIGAIVLGYSAARAASLDVMMIADSRYYVQQWFTANVPRDASVAMVGLGGYLPNLDGFRSTYIRAVEDLPEAAALQYVVINSDYIRRFEPGGPFDEFYQRLARRDGYSLALRYRTPLTWLPLAHDPVFKNGQEETFTNLDKINPQIEIYRRE